MISHVISVSLLWVGDGDGGTINHLHKKTSSSCYHVSWQMQDDYQNKLPAVVHKLQVAILAQLFRQIYQTVGINTCHSLQSPVGISVWPCKIFIGGEKHPKAITKTGTKHASELYF